MAFLQTTHEGEIEIDHSASPGMPEQAAIKFSLDPSLTKEGKVYRAPTLGCIHCGGVVILNPMRTRNRNFCPKCNRYICDSCHAVMQQPDYQHRTFLQVAEMLNSGKWRLAGGTSGNPVLLPTRILGGVDG